MPFLADDNRYNIFANKFLLYLFSVLWYTRRPVPYSELFFNVKNAMFILKRYVYFVLYTKLEKEQCFRFIWNARYVSNLFNAKQKQNS